MRRHKLHDSTPEHVDFQIRERADWEAARGNRRQIPGGSISTATALPGSRRRKRAAFFMWSGVNVFESIHPICGHEKPAGGHGTRPGLGAGYGHGIF